MALEPQAHGAPPIEETLLDAAVYLTDTLDVRHICAGMLSMAERLFDATSCWILIHDPNTDELVTVDFHGPDGGTYAGVRIPADYGVVGLVFQQRQLVFVPDVRAEHRWFDVERVHASRLRSVYTAPLEIGGVPIGVVGLDSPRLTAETPPSPSDARRLRSIASVAAAGIRNARLLEEVEQDRIELRRLIEQRQHLRIQVGQLRDQVRHAQAVAAIVGTSPTFREVMTQVELVAPADSTVLLVGETGTGKELIARAVHDGSRRAGKPFVAVNCAALPETLVESELFGYEKGAFTGAVARKSGKFEQAHLGTLFLDEIGDLPAQAQAKLLRILQEREVHRVGGTRPVPVDVRLIAATNQDLEDGIRKGLFRADLFYRLSVFPIVLPPLRERRADIPALAEYFVRRFADREHKPVPQLSEQAMASLINYDWPGNIRELQNIIERAVILVRGSVIEPQLMAIALHRPSQRTVRAAPATASPVAPPRSPDNVIRFSDAERRAILRALEACGWRISGPRGAAETLGLKPTTLHAKMKKLGITRPRVAAVSVSTRGIAEPSRG